MSDVLVLIEIADGQPARLSLEALRLARQIVGEPPAAVGTIHARVLEPGGPADGQTNGSVDRAALVDGLGAFGVAVVQVVGPGSIDAYAPAAWASAALDIMKGGLDAGSYAAVVAPSSDRATEVLAHIGARAGLPMAANVVGVTPGDRWRIVRQRWAGSLLEDAWLDGEPRLMTVAPHALPVPTPVPVATAPTVVQVEPPVSDLDMRAKVIAHEPSGADGVSLGDARVVVGGGRGLGGAEAFAMLDELAALLGGAVGVSRVATSLGWRPHLQQIGQTGARIAPDLYIACGISGAIQHIVGCKAAKRILVINTDPDAPILRRATYAVIGDVHTVVPAVIAEIRLSRAG
jgi:electron transfer flavoprotein alpha subunit